MATGTTNQIIQTPGTQSPRSIRMCLEAGWGELVVKTPPPAILLSSAEIGKDQKERPLCGFWEHHRRPLKSLHSDGSI